MRKAVLLVIIVGATIGLLMPKIASAQSIYAAKFVCGRQAPVSNVTAPVEPPVKPDNYATKGEC
jgi:di/tricarboxylate transporter